MHRILLPFLILCILCPLAACTPYADWSTPGFWQPKNANAANLRVMVANPADLTAGRGMTASAGPESVAPVQALEQPLEAGKMPVVTLPDPTAYLNDSGDSTQ